MGPNPLVGIHVLSTSQLAIWATHLGLKKGGKQLWGNFLKGTTWKTLVAFCSPSNTLTLVA